MKEVKEEYIVGTSMQVSVGIAMLQGARYEHAEAIISAGNELGVVIKVLELRTSLDIDTAITDDMLDALILPGGESTTMRIASDTHGLLMRIYSLLSKEGDFPVLGTCAGAILLSNPEANFKPFVDAKIDRNSYGRQKDSFQAILKINNLLTPEIKYEDESANNLIVEKYQPLPISSHSRDNSKDSDHFLGIFIRAPRYVSIGDSIPVVYHGNTVVGVKEKNILALTFHPELTEDRRFHRWLIDCAINRGDKK